MRALIVVGIVALMADAAHAQLVHNLPDATSPLATGSCLYVDQGPGTDTSLCSGYAAAIGQVQAPANTQRGNWTAGSINDAANPMPACPDTTGNHLNYVSGTGIICGTGAPGGDRQFGQPPGPAATASLTAVMMGLSTGVGNQPTILTPVTGKVFVSMTGVATTSVATDGISYIIRYGTGTPPANGVAATGTAVGTAKTVTPTVVPIKLAIRSIGYITGLTPGVPVWFDVALAAVTGGSAAIAAVNIVALER